MTNTNSIPFLDLVTPHAELKEQLTGVFTAALASAGFIGGRMVEEFERGFASFCDTGHCVGVASGTDALRFALMAAGVQTGDVVVTVPNTFIATVEAISQAGASPAFVDVDGRTCNMDASKLEEYLESGCTYDAHSGHVLDKKSGRRVTAIVPVHLYGQMADMVAIVAIAERYNLMVIEDACQAHGAKYYSKRENRWRTAGSIGKAAAFSFYPGKNLGACGEAGAVTTNDEGIAAKVRMLRDHGQSRKYFHDVEGYNGRLDSIQAGILNVKLAHLAAWNEKRRENAARYDELLSPAEHALKLPYQPSWSKAVYHLYVIGVADRDRLQQQLTAAGIGTGIHYPVPLHLQKAYQHLGYRPGDLPVAERTAAAILSLPMYPGLEAYQQERVVEGIFRFISMVPEQKLAATAVGA
jgi:dTDP-4-amino-4,6-dideoxygalactose transaminase